MLYEDFEFGKKTLKFWDDSKVELLDFLPEGKDKKIRYFNKKGFSKYDKESKIISRSAFSSFREPFEIEPWNQILIDEANIYGTLVDINKEKALRKLISDEEVMQETRMSVGKIINEGLIWVARGQMVCHKESIIYGEIDEIWYDKKTDTYIVGDTKTSSTVDKMSYWYQLSIYIEILRSLNPDKKISSIGIIDWVKIKKEKWIYNKNFIENDWKDWIGKEIKKTDPVYKSRWKEKISIETEETNLLVKRDLERDHFIDLVRKEFKLISDFKISSIIVFKEKLKEDEKFIHNNKLLQKEYEHIKKNIE